MSDTGTGGYKFGLRFEVEGRGKEELRGIHTQLGEIINRIGTSGAGGGLAGSFERVNESVSKIGESFREWRGLEIAEMGIDRGIEMLEKVNEVGHGMVETGVKALEVFPKLGEMVLQQLSPLEQAIIRIKAMGNMSMDLARQRVELAQDIVQYTPFLERQVVGIETALVSGKVSLDAYRDSAGQVLTINKAQAEGFADLNKTALDMAGDMRVTATSLVTDLAAMTGNVGERMDRFVYGFQMAMATGSKAALRHWIPADIMQQIFGSGAGKRAHVQGEKAGQQTIDKLYEYLKKKHAVGSAALASATYEGIISNFKDLPLLFSRAIGGMPGSGGFYDKLRDGLADVFNSISRSFKNKEWQESIRNGLLPVMESLVFVVGMLGKGIGWMLDKLGHNPKLLQFISVMMVVGGVVLIVGGSLTIVTAIIGMFTLGIMSAIVGLIGFVMFLGGPLVIALLALAGIIFAVTFAFTGWIAILGAVAVGMVYFLTKTDTFQHWWDKVTLFIHAAQEALENWGGATTRISLETAQSLEKAGILGFFLDAVQFIRVWEVRIRQIFSGIRDGVDEIMHTTKVQDMWDALDGLVNSFKTLMNVLGGVETGMTASDAAGNEFYNTSKNLTFQVANLIEFAAKVGTAIVLAFAQGIYWVDLMKARLELVLAPVKELINDVMALDNVLRGNFAAAKELWMREANEVKNAMAAAEKSGYAYDTAKWMAEHPEVKNRQETVGPVPLAGGATDYEKEMAALGASLGNAKPTPEGKQGASREPVKQDVHVSSTAHITLEVDKRVLAETFYKHESDEKDRDMDTPAFSYGHP